MTAKSMVFCTHTCSLDQGGGEGSYMRPERWQFLCAGRTGKERDKDDQRKGCLTAP
jgi:hypothetical protein